MSYNDYASDVSRPKRAHSKPNRIDLKVNEIVHFIDDQGIFVRVTPSIVCPNKTDVADTNHTLDCPICNGNEVVDLDDKAFETWALMQAVSLDKQFNPQGLFDTKDARITFKPEVRIYYWYKIEALDFASPFNQLVKRGSGEEDKLRYPHAAHDLDIPTYLVDKIGNRYERGVDFQFETDKVKWLTSRRPAFGSLYSISYPILPTYRVLETLHDNRLYYLSFKKAERHAVNLPQEAVIRWDYLAQRSGNRELVGTT